ncbi:3-hydroxyacyl-CoA dehydrogenase [Psychromonas sp. CNPT3]|uniref:3-hydroxyacyl-CoA dehydrogenase NAD-binding domain-containing protein n=1 Tax=Psychromonas sp. CNPT3 TaxID=314282 RepID=UPI00006E916C|nr:3-hydroxyacyl-CoA dehydrogenase NAD-binding domain-containing protein [Psychromonas sp. CNPT3]AGH81312.1 3-hydroxyacyl-CoA dehydrogenase [Psychromonas sp. CNPT3]
MNFTLTLTDNGVATLCFDMPDASINKLDSASLVELQTHLKNIKDDNNIKLLVFTSLKPGIFIAGADINEIKSISSCEEAFKKAQMGQLILHQISLLPFPSLAVINGACVGGGCELALACTYRLMSGAKQAKIGLPEVSLGIIPGFGGCVRLPKLIGLSNALTLILSAKLINAKKAYRLHLIDAVYDAQQKNQVDDFIDNIICGHAFKKNILKKRIQKKNVQGLLDNNRIGQRLIFKKAQQKLLQKTKGHYPAPLLALKTIEKTLHLSIDEALLEEVNAFASIASSEISKNLIQLYFTQDALKKESGVNADDISPKDVAQLGVLGAGVMGGGIAWLCSQNGIDVRLKDIDWNALNKGYQTASGYYAQMQKHRKITPAQIRFKMNKISGAVKYHGFKQIDFVIEAVVEKIEIKKTVLREVEKELPEHAIIASNTSSLSITEMATALDRPENFIGMHFFNPVNRMPLVEIISGEKSSPETIACAVKLAKAMHKTPIVVADCSGFLINRILIPMLNEAALLLQEGASVTEIDSIITEFGLPMGPFTLADEVGIDIAFHVASMLQGSYGERMKVADILEHVYKEHHFLGKKSGLGFYLHSPKKAHKPRYNSNLDIILTYYRAQHHQFQHAFTQQTILDRCMLIMVNEAARCIEENVVKNASYLDMGIILGAGFPAFRGGILKYADNRGLTEICETLTELATKYGNRFTPAPLLLQKAQQNSLFYSPS